MADHVGLTVAIAILAIAAVVLACSIAQYYKIPRKYR
jgi:hypothetical protein